MGSIDRKGYIRYVSDACKTILGYERNELIGVYYADYLHPEDRVSTSLAIQDALASGQKTNFENRFLHRKGHAVPIGWPGVWSADGEILYCAGRDMTELKASEQRYKALFDNSPDIVFVECTKGLVTEGNQLFNTTFRHSEAQLIGAAASSFLSPEAAKVNAQYLQQALQGKATRFELRLEKDGETRIYDTHKYPVLVNNEVECVQTIARDITPIVHSYETIEQQAAKLHTIFESITDAFFTLDSNWNFAYINSEAERLLSLNREYHVGKNAWKEFPSEIHGVFFRHYHHAAKTGKAVHFEAYYAETDRWLEVKAYPSAEGMSVYFDDVTEKVQARQELEKLSLVASKTNNSVLIADSNWRIEWVNEGFTRLLGYNLEEAVGKRPSELLHDHRSDRTTYDALEGKLLAGEPIAFEVLNVKKSGEAAWLNVDITALFKEDGQLTRFIEVQTDITALKTSELELTQSAKDLYRHNKDLEQFTYIVSHNLRAPVANALGLVTLLTKIDKGTAVYDN